MSRVSASHDPTPNDVTKVSHMFHRAFDLLGSRRFVCRQTTVVSSWGIA